MKKYLFSVTLIISTHILLSATCDAQTRRYEVYRTDRFGIKRDALRPHAVIEIDEETDTARMYDTDKYGFPDILSEPSYMVESSPFNSPLDTDPSDEDCEHDHHDSRRHFHDDDSDDHDDDF